MKIVERLVNQTVPVAGALTNVFVFVFLFVFTNTNENSWMPGQSNGASGRSVDHCGQIQIQTKIQIQI